jgi:hypothetical protein
MVKHCPSKKEILFANSKFAVINPLQNNKKQVLIMRRLSVVLAGSALATVHMQSAGGEISETRFWFGFSPRIQTAESSDINIIDEYITSKTFRYLFYEPIHRIINRRIKKGKKR